MQKCCCYLNIHERTENFEANKKAFQSIYELSKNVTIVYRTKARWNIII